MGTSARAGQAPTPPPATPSPAPDACGDGNGHSALLSVLSRPTFGLPPCAIKPGEHLVEMGYQNATGTGNAPSHDATFPQTFVRFGLRPNFEVDLVAPDLEATLLGTQRISGFQDSGLGAKLELFHDAATVVGLGGIFTPASGSAGLTAGSPTLNLTLAASHQITPHFGAGVTFVAVSSSGITPAGAIQRFTSLQPAVSVSEQVGSSAQFDLQEYGATRVAPGSLGGRYATDVAFQMLLNPRFEVDFSAGRSITDAARLHYYGFGLGIRW